MCAKFRLQEPEINCRSSNLKKVWRHTSRQTCQSFILSAPLAARQQRS